MLASTNQYKVSFTYDGLRSLLSFCMLVLLCFLCRYRFSVTEDSHAAVMGLKRSAPIVRSRCVGGGRETGRDETARRGSLGAAATSLPPASDDDDDVITAVGHRPTMTGNKLNPDRRRRRRRGRINKHRSLDQIEQQASSRRRQKLMRLCTASSIANRLNRPVIAALGTSKVSRPAAVTDSTPADEWWLRV